MSNFSSIPTVGMPATFYSEAGPIKGKISHIYAKNKVEFQMDSGNRWMYVFSKRKDGFFRLVGSSVQSLVF